ncbi:MAG TPA: phosphomethylpyrimidine synthase ThiC, partial [bacterium]|nr:phosphomethylpyrimidine synthase ThiC [bacterium]
VCDGALYYVLGSLVTDIAPGYDHITSAIGGTLAAIAGADYLCYVTPAEHLRLPTLEDVRNGVIASRIAAHAADIVKGIAGASEWDDQMSKARKSFKWEDMFALAIDPETARAMRKESGLSQDEMCTMCGDYCSMRQGTQTARKN